MKHTYAILKNGRPMAVDPGMAGEMSAMERYMLEARTKRWTGCLEMLRDGARYVYCEMTAGKGPVMQIRNGEAVEADWGWNRCFTTWKELTIRWPSSESRTTASMTMCGP